MDKAAVMWKMTLITKEGQMTFFSFVKTGRLCYHITSVRNRQNRSTGVDLYAFLQKLVLKPFFKGQAKENQVEIAHRTSAAHDLCNFFGKK